MRMSDAAKPPKARGHAAYDGNPLIEACGPILSAMEIAKRLMHLPAAPCSWAAVDGRLLEHAAAGIWRLHVPTAAGIELAQSIDVMLRQGYLHRNPSAPATWRRIYSQIGAEADSSPVQLAATVTGLAGTGKSTAIERALQLYPQVAIHESFPGLVGPVRQLLWLKVDVPASGKIRDLVETFAHATDAALDTSVASDLLGGRRTHGATLAHRWLQRISCHFPGVIVLDEVQNLFKIERKAVREDAARRQATTRPALRIVDDEALKLLLTITNSSKIPTIWCSTPDGLEAFNSRMSTSQRLLTAGFHRIPRPASADDEYFRKRFFPVLCRYQWLPRKLLPTDELRRLMFELTGGVLRVCLMLWIQAHRRAALRGAEQLDFDDFRDAASQSMAPLQPSVQALHSGDPRRLGQFEDVSADLPGSPI